MNKSIFLIIFTIVFFNGCISVTKEIPAFNTYTLSLKENKKELKYLDKSIHIFEPKALGSLNTKNINYSKESFMQEQYALSRWSDKPTKMLQQIIANYLVSKNTYKFITTSNIKVNTDYKIVSQLVDFKQTFTKKASYADFSIRVYLINNKSDEVFFKSFTYNQKAPTNNAKGLVLAINAIKNNFLEDLNNFIYLSISNN